MCTDAHFLSGNFSWIFRINRMLLSHWTEEGHAHLALSTVCLLTLKKREEKRERKRKDPGVQLHFLQEVF